MHVFTRSLGLCILFVGMVHAVSFSQQNWSLNMHYSVANTDSYIEHNIEKSFTDSLSLINYFNEYLDLQLEKGYMAAGFDSICFVEDTVNAYFTKGAYYSWEKIVIYPKEYQTLEKEIKYQKYYGKPLKYSKVLMLREEILEYFENNGYPFCNLSFSEPVFSDNKFSSNLKINTGDLYVFDSIIIKSNGKTKSKFLENYLDWKVGGIYSEKYLKSIPISFSNIEFLEMPKPFELAFRNGKTDLYLYLKEKKSSRFSGILGILPNNSVSNKLVLTGDIDLSLQNVVGNGEKLILNWQKYQALSQQLFVDFSYPYIFGTKIGTSMIFAMEKQDTSYLNTDFKLGVNYYLQGFNGLGVFYQRINSYKLGSVSNGNIANVHSNLWGLKYKYSHLDYVFNPRSGFIINASAAAGIKQTSADLNQNASNTLQVRSLLDAGLFIPILQKFTFYIHEQAAYIYDNNLYANELYRLGGIKNIRGIDELSIFASAYSVTSIEFRYLFERNSSFFLRSDIAFIENKTEFPIYRDIPWSVGLGMNLFTKAGTFSLSYAVASLQGNAPDLKSAKIHIGYLNRF